MLPLRCTKDIRRCKGFCLGQFLSWTDSGDCVLPRRPAPGKLPAMTILVTGGTGFVGSAVVRALIARGERPRCLVRRGSDRRNLQGMDVDLVEGDLTHPESLAGAVKGCDRPVPCRCRLSNLGA